tara:strand:- start:10872 stop:12215 length:1344 start_codon:yes stop_codon:yes gene_type:complete
MGALRNLFNNPTVKKYNPFDVGSDLNLGLRQSIVEKGGKDPFRDMSNQENIFGSSAYASTAPEGTNNAIGAIKPPQVQGAQTSVPYGPVNPAGIAPSGGGLASNPDANTKFDNQQQQQTTVQQPSESERLNKELQDELERRGKDADSIFNPLMTNYDNRIGGLKGEQEGLAKGIESGSQLLSQNLTGQRDYSLGKLGENEVNVREGAQKSLRDVASDQRNITTSTARQLGARGAGDTSAGDYAGAAIGREGLKQRGNVLESQAQGLREIDGRRADVQNTYMTENSRIQSEKQNQLQSLAKDYAALNKQYEDAKANTTSERAAWLSDAQVKLRQNLSDKLYEIDKSVKDRRNALEDWATKEQISNKYALELLAGKAKVDSTNTFSRYSAAQNALSGSEYTLNPTQVVSDIFPGVNDPSSLLTKKPNEDDIFGGLLTEEEKRANGLTGL